MRRTPTLAVAAAVLALAGCSSSTKPAAVSTTAPAGVATSATPAADTSTSGPATIAPATSSTCNLPDRGDIIVRESVPRLPVSAQELGGTNPEHCVLTFDSLRTSQPTGAGYCTQAAWVSDNPGYDPNAVPAPPLKKVQVTVGDCG